MVRDYGRMCVMLSIAAVLLGGNVTATCQSTQEVGQRRGCIDSIISIKNSDECKAACCADSAANPIPYPGLVPQGCVAWYAGMWSPTGGQCFMCKGSKNGQLKPVPPANATCQPKSTCLTGVVTPTLGPQPPQPPKIIPHIGTEGSVEYVNVIDGGIRVPQYANGSGTALNKTTELTPLGWPRMDCQITIFDDRPTHAWALPMDDPQHRQADFSGEWTVTLVGNATISLDQSIGISMGAASYDDSTNVLTQPIIFAKGSYPKVQNLLVLKFTNTRALPSSPQTINGTGFVDLKVYRPGYAPGAGGEEDKSTQLFTDNWASLLSIFDRVRWMGATGTNSYMWGCAPPNAASCSVVTWDTRRTPDMPVYQSNLLTSSNPLPWEHVLLAANELNSDVWINVPLTASSPTVCRSDPNGDHTKCIKDDPKSTYEYQLALLFRDGNNYTNNIGLKPNLKIYVEHSNEVWNFGFKQNAMNTAFSEWEVLNSSQPTNLNKLVPDHPDIEQRQQCTNMTKGVACWGRRRHARRVYEISKTFEEVFGPKSLNNRVRMIYASWGLENAIQTYFNDTLYWLEAETGDISKYIYAISYAQYFGPTSQNVNGKATFNYSTATIPQVIEAFNNATVSGIEQTIEFVKLAKAFKVKSISYEGGPGYHVGGEHPGSTGLNTMITASRDIGMVGAVKENIDVCWQFGWDEYQYFSAQGGVSEYGCWGAVEFWKDLNPGPPKLQALYQLTGHSPKERIDWAKNHTRNRAQRFHV